MHRATTPGRVGVGLTALVMLGLSPAQSTALMLSAAPPATAAPTAFGARAAVREDAFARLAAVRRAVDAGSLASAVRGAAALVEVAVEERHAALSSPSAALPAGLAEPVAALQSAIREAGSLARRSLRLPATEVQRRADRFALALGRGGGMVGRDAGELRSLSRFEGLAEELVDRSMLYSGALLLAEALDANIPLLRRYTSTLSRSKGAAGCEVAEQAPALCIGGTGENTYTGEYALVIDLGGDDVHSHSAGSADPLVNDLDAAVTIDIAGDDRYESTSPADSGAVGAQGSGNVGGIGVLVDAGGNDTYSITSTDPVMRPSTSDFVVGPQKGQTLGQGFGAAGVGILSDASGSDSYSILGTPAAETNAPLYERANGQAYALAGAMTLALDGGGDDNYSIETRPSPSEDDDGVLHPGNPITLGYGYSTLGGSAIFSDAGGTDDMRISATIEPVSPEETRAFELPSASAGGGGIGIGGGAGVVLTGAGSSTWVWEAEVRAPNIGFVGAGGHATGALGGYGAFHDAGGSDRYTAEAAAFASASRTTDEACVCSGPNAVAMTSDRTTAGLGPFGILGGIGVMHEAGGSDVYVSEGAARAEALAHDAVASPPKPRTASAAAFVGVVRTTGLGLGEVAGDAFFLDAGLGDDSYSVLAESHAQASASAASPETRILTTEGHDLTETLTMGFAAAGGYADFQDVGGDDSYNVISRSTDSLGVEDFTQTFVMGSTSDAGIALFRDAGGSDAVTLLPPEPVCAGEPRGTGRYWMDCEGPAFGVNV